MNKAVISDHMRKAEHALTNLREEGKKEDRKTFWMALTAAAIFYFPMLSVWLTNPDGFWNGMVYKNGSGWENRQGRFGLSLIYKLKGYMISPTCSTFFSFLMLALICVIVRRILKLEKSWLIFCMIFVMVLTPGVMSTMTYYYCSDAYFFAYFLNAAAVYILTFYTGRKWVALAAAMMAFSLSCYQAYIGIAVVLCLLVLWKTLLEGKEEIKSVAKLACRYAAAGLLSVIVYFAVFQLLQRMLAYQAAEKLTFPSLRNIPFLVLQTYRYFVQYFFTNGFLYNDWYGRKYWNAAVVIAAMIIFLFYMCVNKWKPARVFLILGCMLCMPPAFMMITVLAPGINIYAETGILMLPAMNYLYLIPIILLSVCRQSGQKFIKAMEWSVGIIYFRIITLLIAFVFAFQGYMQLNLYRMMTIAPQMEMQIETVQAETADGGEKRLPVVFAGKLPDIPYHNVMIDPVYGTTAEYNMIWYSYEGRQQSWIQFLRHMTSHSYETADFEEYGRVIKSREFAEMPVFPASGSVKVINEVIVVKLNSKEDLYSG